jgi:gamma-tubulin complex component 2
MPNGGKSERQDARRPKSPQASTHSAQHKRMPSGSQRMGRVVDERRTDRVHVTTRETVTTRTRSPDRRTANAGAPPAPPRPMETSKAVDPRIKPKSDLLQGESKYAMYFIGIIC